MQSALWCQPRPLRRRRGRPCAHRRRPSVPEAGPASGTYWQTLAAPGVPKSPRPKAGPPAHHATAVSFIAASRIAGRSDFYRPATTGHPEPAVVP
jgi:hypothetical protein